MIISHVSPARNLYSIYLPPFSVKKSDSLIVLPWTLAVVGCNNLRDTEWFSRQDPYVRLEYASNKYRTKTCTDGGKNPTFQERIVLTLIEGLREIDVAVWNSNTIKADDLIGSGKILLQKVLSNGYDDSSWSLQSRNGKTSGEVRVIMHYQNANKSAKESKASTAQTRRDDGPPERYPPSVGSNYGGFPPPPVAWQPPQVPPPAPLYQSVAYPPQPYGYPSPAYPTAQPYGQPPYPGQYPRPYPY